MNSHEAGQAICVYLWWQERLQPVQNGERISYKVLPRLPDGRTGDFTVESAYTVDWIPPAAPTGFFSFFTNEYDPFLEDWFDYLNLAWTASPDAVKYVVYFWNDGADPSQIRSRTMTSTTWRIIKPTQSTWFQVSAVDAAGNESPRLEAMFVPVPVEIPDEPVPLPVIQALPED